MQYGSSIPSNQQQYNPMDLTGLGMMMAQMSNDQKKVTTPSQLGTTYETPTTFSGGWGFDT
jgi:hypothetical protein